MEGFLEANRVVEVSLSKLSNIHRSGELPLRKTLLISKVLNRAQNVATSAHLTLINSSPTPRSSSKLLASISKKVTDTSAFESDCLPAGPTSRPSKVHREQSPIVSCVSKSEDEEPMDFENVSSVLSDILDNETPAASEESPLVKDDTTNLNEQLKSPKRSKLFADISNTRGWDSWQFDLSSKLKNDSLPAHQWSPEPNFEFQSSPTAPVSPGKRNHTQAFPFIEKENTALFDIWDDSKRFKPSPPEGCPLESLPGFCGYLSPRNLQSAPLITYLFGKGFAEPSDPSTTDWPSDFTHGSEHGLSNESTANRPYIDNHFPTPIQTSPVAPILAF